MLTKEEFEINKQKHLEIMQKIIDNNGCCYDLGCGSCPMNDTDTCDLPEHIYYSDSKLLEFAKAFVKFSDSYTYDCDKN